MEICFESEYMVGFVVGFLLQIECPCVWGIDVNNYRVVLADFSFDEYVV